MMGCRVIVGVEQGTDQALACLFDSVTGVVFGPVFTGAWEFGDPEAEVVAFLAWLADEHGPHAVDDPRKCTGPELDALHGEWVNTLAVEGAAT